MGATAITAIATCWRGSFKPSPEPRLVYQNVEFVKQNILIDGIKGLRKSQKKKTPRACSVRSRAREIFFHVGQSMLTNLNDIFLKPH